MSDLRYYQNNGVNELSKGFAKFLRQLLVVPTGGGKTHMFAEIIRRAVMRGTVVMVLTDRKELHKQAVNAVKRHSIPVCEINAENKNIFLNALLYVGMVETVSRRIEIIKNIKLGLIIVDESHKGNFFKILDAFPTVKTIGCTATPINKKLHLYYQNLIAPVDIPELIKEEFLTPCKAYQMQDDFSDLVVKSGEYSEASQFKHFAKAKLYAGVIDEYMKRIRGLKTICFCVNVKHVEETYSSFKAVGLPAYFVHSKMLDQERDFMIKEFENDPNGIMINCGILSTGYDHPPVSAIIIYRKTKSLALWLQMQGRGSRIYRNKNQFVVLDFGRNHDELGLWDEARTWTLEPPKKKSNKEKPAPVKKCPQCEAIIAARAMKCSFCGYDFPEEAPGLKTGVMVEVQPKVPSALVGKKAGDLNIDELIELQKSKKYKASFVWRVTRSKGEEAIKEYAEKMGYKNGWIERQIQDQENSEFNNYILK